MICSMYLCSYVNNKKSFHHIKHSYFSKDLVKTAFHMELFNNTSINFLDLLSFGSLDFQWKDPNHSGFTKNIL